MSRPKEVQRLLLNLPNLLPDIADVPALLTYVERLEETVHAATVLALDPNDRRSYDAFIDHIKAST